MRSLSAKVFVNLSALGLFSVGFSGCSSEADPDPSSGGSGGSTGGIVSTGGVQTGGAVATGGSTGGVKATGGAVSTGGVAPTGGSVATGGAAGPTGGASGGTAGQAPVAGNGGTLGGGGGSGGVAGKGGSPSMAGSGGSSGGAASGDCVKGQTKGSQVAMIGESFIAASHGITKTIEDLAKAAGSLGQSERYVDNSVSGTLLSGNNANAIPAQYAKALQSSGTLKYVLMDGGGNDCLQANNGDAALAAADTLFKKMATDKVEKVVYFFYPDPLGSFASGTLKTCLDALRPKMKMLCDGLTAPKCYWLDLRTVWNGHNEYTQDGIHPTPAGDKATGEAIWEVMKTNCVAQ